MGERLEQLEIQILDGDADHTVVADVATLVNRAYAIGEAGLWRDGTTRTTDEEMAGLIAAGEIAVARVGDTAMGAIRIRRLDDGAGEFGMLAVDPDQQGGGIGRQLVDFAEDLIRKDGLEVMQLELLVPKDWKHPAKEALREWYTRRGYHVVRTGDFAAHYPDLAPLLATPCNFLILHKALT